MFSGGEFGVASKPIEVRAGIFPTSFIRSGSHEPAFPAGMEPTGVVRHGQSPEGVNERERVSQSKSTSMHITKSLMRAALKKLRSRRESNPHLRFRKPPFYPLNYGNKNIFDFRFSIADCKQRKANG